MTLPASFTTFLKANTHEHLALAFSIFIAVYFTLYVFRCFGLVYMRRLAKKTTTNIDDAVIEALQGINVSFYTVISFAVASRPLILPSIVDKILLFAVLFVVINEVIKLFEKIIIKILSGNKESSQVSGVIHVAVRFCLWAIGLLLILSNLGFNITSLVAGLGIGGLAISLALQHILTDVFSSFSIALDKPFEEGDFVVVGEHKGTVKHIGLKTTRIQSLEGEEIVISNTELTSTSRIQNYKKMEERRVMFTVGVTYDTPADKLEAIPGLIESIISAHDCVRFDRAHFVEFADSSLNIEVVFYMLSSDYTLYMNTKQAINLAILRAFEEAKIDIAFPTQTVHLVK